MNTTDKVIDRIKKLFALAERNNSPEEAAAAAAAAQELLFQHKLSSADLEAADDEEDVLGTEDVDAVGSWRKSLAHGVAKAFYCKACTTADGKRVRIVGKLSDTQAASYMTSYLVSETNQLAARHAAGMGRSWANSFRLGVVCTVLERLNAQRKEQEVVVAAAPAGTALAIRNDGAAVSAYFQELFPHTKKGGRVYARSTDGLHAGRQAGHSVGLGGGKGLGAAPKRIGS